MTVSDTDELPLEIADPSNPDRPKGSVPGARPAPDSRRSRTKSRDEPLADTIREAVLAQIVDGTLRAGEMISLAELARDFGTSKMPVRDALNALKRDGLMDSVPYKGFIVRAVDMHDVEEVNFVRELLECASAGLASERISQEQLRRLRKLETDDLEDARRSAIGLQPDRTSTLFHTVIAEASHNRRLGAMIALVLRDVHRIQYAAQTLKEAEENHREHLGIIEALSHGDFDESVATMRRHLRSVESRGRDAMLRTRRAAGVHTRREIGSAESETPASM